MKKIILDTNFLIDAVRFKIDLSEITNLAGLHTLAVPTSVIRELEEISKSRKAESKFAKLALGIAENFQTEKSSRTNADADIIIVAGADEDTVVATNDSELRKILKSKGVKTIYLRARKHLAIG